VNDGQIMRVSHCFNGGGGRWRLDGAEVDVRLRQAHARRVVKDRLRRRGGIDALVEVARGMSGSWGIPKRGGGGVEATLPHLTKHAPQCGMDKGEEQHDPSDRNMQPEGRG